MSVAVTKCTSFPDLSAVDGQFEIMNILALPWGNVRNVPIFTSDCLDDW